MRKASISAALAWSHDAEAQLDTLDRRGPIAVPRTPDKEALDRLCVDLAEQGLAELDLAERAQSL